MLTGTIITALAAFITATASLLMVLEMRRHRIAVTRPTMKLASKNSRATSTGGTHWDWEDSESDVHSLSVINFGTGPALDVTVEWFLDEEGLINAIKHYDPHNLIKIKNDNDLFYLDNSVHNMKNQKIQFIDGIPAYNGINEKIIRVPSWYISGFERFYDLAIVNRPRSKKFDSTEQFMPPFLPIRVGIRFQDINRTIITEHFKITLEPSYIEFKEDNKTFVFGVHYDIEKEP